MGLPRYGYTAARISVLLFSFMGLTGVGVNYAYGRDSPPQNPYLASSYNNQGHWNDAATDATDIAIPRGHYRVTPDSYDVLANDALGIPFYASVVQGRDLRYFWTGFQYLKLEKTPAGYREIDRIAIDAGFSNYQPVSQAQRLAQARAVESYLRQGDEQALADYLAEQPNRLLTAVEDQVSRGILYSLFAKDDVLIAANARGLIRIEQTDPSDPASPLHAPLLHQLPPELFDDARAAENTFFPADTVFGLGMTFNGVLVINTVSGRLVTLRPETFEILDTLTLPEGEVITNAMATSDELEGSAVYVASNTAMYRLSVKPDGRISQRPDDGAWRARYERGRRFEAGKIADGTGATPTLMGFGPDDDKLVLITDGADKMGLVAFWRDSIPADAVSVAGRDPRIADIYTVDFGDPISQSEQSVVAANGYAFVVSSVPQERTAPLPARGAYLRGLLTGVTRPPVMGLGMFFWNSNSNRWEPKWLRDDVGSLATVPMMSLPSRQVIINGYFKDRPGEGFYLGFDLDKGDLVMSIAVGINPLFNGTFTGLKCDPDGNIWFSMMFGLVTLDTRKMPRVANPDPRLRVSD